MPWLPLFYCARTFFLLHRHVCCPSGSLKPFAVGDRRSRWTPRTERNEGRAFVCNTTSDSRGAEVVEGQTLGMALGYWKHTDWRKEEVSGWVALGPLLSRLRTANVRQDSQSEGRAGSALPAEGWQREIEVEPITQTHCYMGLTWNGRLLEQAEMQQCADGVGRRRR